MILGLILFGMPTAIIAASKGFKPLRWMLAFGLIGLIVVLCLSSAKAEGISPAEAQARAAKANAAGAAMCAINLALGFISLLIVMSSIR